MKRSILWAALAALLVAACAAQAPAPTASTNGTLPTVTVYRSPT